MKHLKLIYTLLAASLSLTAMQSCVDLTPLDYSEINPSNFPKTEDDLQALVLSCYYPLRGNYSDGIFSMSECGVQWINDAMTSILTGTYGLQMEAGEMNNFYPENSALTWLYYSRDSGKSGFANKVSRCTLVLDQIERSSLDESTKLRYEAEVRCARGFLSYLLYDMYGPIVVAPLEVLQNPLKEKALPRLSRAEMVKFIEDDLKFAEENLPMPQAAEYGRFSKGLAKMLLIRLYLHETADYNYPEGQTTGDRSNYNKVEQLARELKTPAYGYSLQPNYPKMFEIGGQGTSNKEIIWGIPCSVDGPNANQWHMMCLPTNFEMGGMQGGWGTCTSTWKFYDSFEPGDTRRTYLIASYTTSDGKVVDRETESSPLAKGPIAMKFGYDPGVRGAGGHTNIDIIVFRYADVYLSLAEALCEKPGATTADFKEAIDNVNVVRNRAGLGNLSLRDYDTEDKLLDAILMERWHEFWLENGQFRADLIRHGKLVDWVVKMTDSPYAADYKQLYPLPLSVISDGKGQVVQNPGY